MRSFPTWTLLTLALTVLDVSSACGDGPADNRPDQVRPIPPKGIDVAKATIEALGWRCQALRTQWEAMREQQDSERLRDLESEVLVFPRAVELAIEFGQFYKDNEPALASELLDEATRRIEVVRDGGHWPEVVGLSNGATQQLIVGGYPSKLDGSFQPYAMVVPSGCYHGDSRPRRLDLWFHGRGETLSEIAFLNKQRRQAGQYTPRDTVVLHPYGRYSNAFKFAGEIDVLESLDYIRGRLPIDPDLISVRGFSMGGAACWQFATHYADRWFAANPGAGFSETPEFLRFFQDEPVAESAPSYQQTLWQLYDCPPWAVNLTHCPTVVYSGELDRQKQAADVMEVALQKVGVKMTHVIGPQTAHKIHPDSKVEIEARMEQLARSVRRQVPRHVEFATVTLRYHRMHWVDVRGLNAHWTPARVSADVEGLRIKASTTNVSRLRFQFASGQFPGYRTGPVEVVIDGTTLVGPAIESDRSWTWELSREGDRWVAAKPITELPTSELRKRPGLQGPIDDAFMDTFVFVLPSGQSSDKHVDRWVRDESLHAMLHWRKQFRGDVQQKLDTQLTDLDIQSANLVLFGDPESNAIIRLIQNDLPIDWKEASIEIGNQSVERSGRVPILIYPNPLNRNRYVVLNSGFTYREYDYLNNARQTPKLPDWSLVDVREGATTQLPGVVEAAGFFDEQWRP